MSSPSASTSPDNLAAARRKSWAAFIEKYDTDYPPLPGADKLRFHSSPVVGGNSASAAGADDKYVSAENDDKLDDEYDFDDQEIADVPKRGVDQATLLRASEEANAASFEGNLAAERIPKANTPPLSKLNPYAATFTPSRAEDRSSSDDSSSTCESDSIGAHIKGAMAAARARRRLPPANRAACRFSWVQDARETAFLRSRMSGAGPAEKGTCAQNTSEIRHRKSIARAADVLVCAGLDQNGDESTIEILTRVAEAMDHARRNHRRSVAHAMRLVGEEDEDAEPNFPASKSPEVEGSDAERKNFASTHARIKETVLSAYHKHSHPAVAAGEQLLQQMWPEMPQMQQHQQQHDQQEQQLLQNQHDQQEQQHHDQQEQQLLQNQYDQQEQQQQHEQCDQQVQLLLQLLQL